MSNKRSVDSGVVFLFVLLTNSFLFGCASVDIHQLKQSLDPSRPSFANLLKLDFFPQQQYQCGPASLATMLVWTGVDVDPEKLLPLVNVPAKQGSYQIELLSAARHYGRIPFVLAPNYNSVLAELQAGHPVLVFQNLGLSWFPQWHYAVVTGIDIDANSVTLHSGTRKNYRMTLSSFDKTWQRTNKWAMVVMPPHRLPASVTLLDYTKTVLELEHIGRQDLALLAYQTAIQHWPTNINLKMALANLNYNTDRYFQARNLYKQVLRMSPGYAPAYNNLAQTYYDIGDYKMALEYATTAVSLGGQFRDNYLHTLNSIHSKLAK